MGARYTKNDLPVVSSDRCSASSRQNRTKGCTMHYEVNRRELISIFCTRFGYNAETLAEMEALWEPFLDSVHDLGLIDTDTRNLWVEAGCPRACLLSALASARGGLETVCEDFDYLDEFEDDLEALRHSTRTKREWSLRKLNDPSHPKQKRG
jgi:hypothetical protein